MKKILICDDEHDIRDVLEMLIEVEFDVEIHHAENGAEGIKKLDENHEFDLIICDMNMPKLKGIDVYKYNKEKHGCHFLLLSADSENDIIHFDGFEDCHKSKSINKPWNHNELIEILRPLLEEAKAS